jgi:glycosyltransferase involved in cell wall biosynthesis
MGLNIVPADILVVIPTYRRASLLETVESALRQVGVTIKVVVVDDCPDGYAEEQIKGLADHRVVYLKNPKPTAGRPSVVRNFGFYHAVANGIEATLVHFLDDDDVVPPGHYAIVKQAFDQRKNIGVVFGTVQPFALLSDDEATRALQEKHLQHERRFFAQCAATALACTSIGSSVKCLPIAHWLFASQAKFGGMLCNCSSALIRREHVDALGGFDTSLRLMEDWEFYARAIQRFGAYFTNTVSIRYRVASPEKSLMHSIIQPEDEKIRQNNEIKAAWRWKQDKLRTQLGRTRFIIGKAIYRTVVYPALKHATKKGRLFAEVGGSSG